MKRLAFTIIALLLCFTVFSLTEEDLEFLKTTESFSGSDLVGSYSQVKGVTGSTRTLTTSGKVIISPNSGIAWLAEKPYVSKLIVAKDHMTQQIRNNKPVKLDVAGNEIYTQIATALECVFFGDFDTMLTLFNAELQTDESMWKLTLQPKSDNLRTFIQKIEINGNGKLNSLCLVESTGDRIDYSFSNLESRELTNEEKAVYSL